MKNYSILLFALIVLVLSGCDISSEKTKEKLFKPYQETALRAPAYPLITIDPYTSAWSYTNNLYDDVVRHWTGKKFPLTGALRVDGVSYRFLGSNELPWKTILPTAADQRWEAAYIETEPKGKWTENDYNDSSWFQGRAAFGTRGVPNLSTRWNTPDIWVRRTFELSEDYSGKNIILEYSHDDVFELYINGIQVVNTGLDQKNNVLLELSEEVVNTLKPGKNIIAAHCHNTSELGYVDFGLYYKIENVKSFETAAIQKSVSVLPLQTFYTFSCGPAELDIIFTAPLLLDDLNLMSRPVNYLSYRVRPTDGNTHDVQLFIVATPHWAVNTPDQETVTTLSGERNLIFAKTGTTEQPILQRRGDDVRIDWGYFYLTSTNKPSVSVHIGEYLDMNDRFISGGSASLAELDTKETKSSAAGLAFCENFGQITTPSTGFVMIGYDDIYSIQYFQDNRLAYWKRNGEVDIIQAFEKADKDYLSIMKRCAAFDKQLMNEAQKSGGKEYAELCALAFRQSVSAHKLIEDNEGNLIFLSKENNSNGSIGTVDISYPSSPLYLLYNPDLLKGMLRPIFYFSESGKWTKPFAAHDVGTYPHANGQTYRGDMPVEESGNMLILTTAIAMVEGNANFAKKHWETLTTWANYLMQEGFDPENQLCTDDFAGRLAHNTNLSIKAIMGIAGYGKLADMLGDKETSQKYIQAAKDMAKQWEEKANDGDHYRLTFDRPDTWSQKYNLVWDKLFGLNIFPKEVAQKEVAFYLTKQNKYGLPLDIRRDYTKTDWINWSSCLADDYDDYRQIMLPVYTYANETVSRIPLSDWHDTVTSRTSGFKARSVVGGYLMKILKDKMTK